MPRITCAGVDTSYEELGSGPTVVLLHGGLSGGESWEPALPALTGTYRVLVPDRRGHGRTADVNGPYTYEAMAEETIAFLEQVAGEPANLVGYSDGGMVALLVVRDRPDLVRRVVTIGAGFHYTGQHPEILEQMQSMDPDAEEMASMREAYGERSPDGVDHWPVVVEKVVRMGATGPTMTVDELRRIDRPVLVISADDDLVTLSHTVELAESLPQGQLAVVPGTSHALPFEKPELLVTLITQFLAEGDPRRVMPIRTAPR
jgi:pimeloyl-ACP methyl ester carboxylesterase